MKIRNFFSLVSLLSIFGGCQKVISIHLNSSSSQYVIQGNITDQPGPYTVSIVRSVNFDQGNNFPGADGALVVIRDNAGVTDTLTETNPGIYQTHSLQGIPGHLYTLSITLNGRLFTASSRMPLLVPFDSLYSIKVARFGSFRPYPVPVYKDPAGIANYYHFIVHQNDSIPKTIFIRNDQLTDGNLIQQPLQGVVLKLNPGDKVKVDMQCIDSSVYQYYYSLEQTINQNAASPANPVSNLAGGALGYFSAHTEHSRSIIIP